MNYEINFLILQSQTENADKIREQVKKLITNNGGKITDELIYQKRKLAYEIKHEQYGFFTVYRFDLEDGEKLKDLTKGLNLEKGVTRHIIVRSNELPELQKEIGKTSVKEHEPKDVAPRKKSGDKILAEISKETKKEEIVKTKPLVEKKTVSQEESVVKKEETKPTKPETEDATVESEKDSKGKSTKKKNTKKKEEISMEDLDKKLDEILDI